MNIKQILNEEWKDSFKGGFRSINTYDVFKNPSKKELLEAGGKRGDIRWLSHQPTKSLYVWNVAASIHMSMAKKLKLIEKLNDYHPRQKKLIGGTAIFKNDRFIVDTAHIIEGEGYTVDDYKDWKWIEKYLDITYLKKQMKGKSLKEEWEDSFNYEMNGPKRTIEVFINPTLKEMDSVSQPVKGEKYLRFIGYKNKIYVFQPTVFHRDAAYEIKLLDKDGNKPNKQYWGSAIRKKGKWELEGSDEDHYKKFYSFIHKYIKPKDGYISGSISPNYINKHNIKEEWEDSVKQMNKTYEIFKNPTVAEMNEVSKNDIYLRFIATVNPNKVYIWNSKLLHNRAARTLDIKYTDPNNISGIIKKINGKWRMDESHRFSSLLNSKEKKEVAGKKWKWTEEYFSGLQDFLENKPFLKEEWKDTVRLPGRRGMHYNDIDIFVNPTTKEMLEAEKHLVLRFIANSRDKKVYVFDPDILHYEMAEKLGIAKGIGDYFNDTKLLGGVGVLSKGKFRMVETPHNLRNIGAGPKELQELIIKAKRDWSFVDKYIANVSAGVKIIAKSYEKELKRKFARKYIKEQYEIKRITRRLI